MTSLHADAPASVADAMVVSPVVHPPTTTLAQARAALTPHRHLVLIVSGRRLLGTLDRDDLDALGADHDGAEPALPWASLDGRTVRAHEPLAEVRAAMGARGRRRVAVVDGHGTLLGLLCLKASGTGFCSDQGIAARRSS